MADNNKYVTTRYGTRINVSGLTPEQTKRVLATAQDKGSYGKKGATLADTFRKRTAAKGAAGGTAAEGGTDPDAGIDPKTGAIDPSDMLEAAPDQITADDLKAEVEKARQGTYDFITKNYERDKAREMEDSKQELAQRGIPIDASSESLWSKTTGGIGEKYQGMYDQASNQAIMAGNTVFGTEAGVANDAFTAFMNAALGMSQNDLTKYGIDQDTLTKLKQIKAQKQIAAANRPSGGGGGGGGDGGGSPIIGGVAPGFGVSNG